MYLTLKNIVLDLNRFSWNFTKVKKIEKGEALQSQEKTIQ